MLKGAIGILIEDEPARTAVGRSAGNTAYKFYPLIAPQSESRPYVLLRRTFNPALDCKDAPSELDKTGFDVVVYAETYEQAYNISVLIRNILDGYKGTINGVVFKALWFSNAEDLFSMEDRTVVIRNSYRALTVNS